jgi:hypothetical protein
VPTIRIILSCTASVLVAACGGKTQDSTEVVGAALSSTTFRQIPLPVAANGEVPAAISDSSAADAWVVGTFTTNPGTTFFTLTEHWNGSTSTIVPSPNLSPSAVNQLLAVADISPTDAWAAGQAVEQNSGTHPLLIHWDGTSWSNFPSAPDPNGSQQYFTAMTALSTNDVWMTGQHFVGGVGEVALIEHFDGRAWSMVPTPNVPNALPALAPVSANDIWAAGGSFILHWDGSAWNQVKGATTPGAPTITSLAAVASNDVWAVGVSHQAGRHGKSLQLIEHWDGMSWSLVATPPASQGTAGELTSVAAVSTNDVWAVGFLTLPNGSAGIEHWDGTSWSLIAVPTTQPPTIGQLNKLSATPGGTVFGLGGSTTGPEFILSTDG